MRVFKKRALGAGLEIDGGWQGGAGRSRSLCSRRLLLPLWYQTTGFRLTHQSVWKFFRVVQQASGHRVTVKTSSGPALFMWGRLRDLWPT